MRPVVVAAYSLSGVFVASLLWNVCDLDYIMQAFRQIGASEVRRKVLAAVGRASVHRTLSKPPLRLEDLLAWRVAAFSVTHQDCGAGHVNAARLARRADFSRLQLLLDAGIWRGLQATKRYMVVGSYAHQLRCLLHTVGERVRIAARVIGWDSKSFLVEHVFLLPINDETSGGAKLDTALQRLSSGQPVADGDSTASASSSSRSLLASREEFGRLVAAGTTALVTAPARIAGLMVNSGVFSPTTPASQSMSISFAAVGGDSQLPNDLLNRFHVVLTGEVPTTC